MPSPRVTFVLIVFQADHTLEPCLASLAPFGPVVAAEGPVKYWQEQGFTTSTDRTNEILEEYCIPTVHGQWAEKDDEVRAAMSLVPPDTEFVFFVDADEIWHRDTLNQIFFLLAGGKVDAMAFEPYSFFAGFDCYMTGFEQHFAWHRVSRMGKFSTHRPPTLLAPDGETWRSKRYVSQFDTARLGMFFFHYSYVFASQMKMKASYYHSKGGTIPDYFNKVWLPWACGTDAERQKIENAYDGVHDWLPSLRGSCRTALFNGSHPPEIAVRLPELRERFNKELAAQ